MSKKIIAGVVGDVTAYAYAKAGGYTGTEEEFQALMAANVEAAKYADEVRAAAAAANEDKEAAAESKDAAAASQADAATSKAAAETAANYARTYTGAPRVAATAAAMTDQSLIYVYTGSETGYTAGNWYFWDGTTWTSGGVYNSTALETDETLTVSGAAADAKVTGDEIGALKSAITDKVDKDGIGQITPKNIQGVTVSGGNILDEAERLYCSQGGAVGNDGYVDIYDGRAIIQNSSGFCSFLIPVKPNTHYTANNKIRFMVTLKDLNTAGTTPVSYGDLVTTAALAYVTSFDTGEAEYVIASWYYNTYPINTFVISEGNTPTTEQTIILPDWLSGGDYSDEIDALETRVDALENVKPKCANITGNLASGGNLQLTSPRNNLRKGERIIFEGNITSFDTIRIGLTYGTSLDGSQQKNTFLIDGSNISYYAWSSSSPVTVAHGLTLSNNIQIIWEMSAEASVKFTLISNGNIFSHEFTNFTRQAVGNPFVLSNGTVLTDCKLTWTCIDIDKQIWMFGDSYFAYSDARWTYYLHQYGYDQNCLLDGFPGEGGTNGRVAFNNLLQFGTPKYAVWCLGMNDGSDSDSAPATGWVTNRDYFLQYCQDNNVTPIFGTIPTVPTINHEQKNAWIRSSGYRYIDFAKAVGASASGVWYGDMLSNDGVHPSESGAKALFARVLVDFPEIMIDE